MVTVPTSAPGEDGIYLVGTLVAIQDGKPWTGKDGRERTPVNVAILVGSGIKRIQFPDRDSAMAGVGPASKGDRLAVRAFPRANLVKGEAELFFDGPRLRDGAED